MRTDEPYVNFPMLVIDLYDQSIVVALDVKDQPLIANDTSVRVSLPHLRRPFPVILTDLVIPNLERPLSIRMTLPEFSKRAFGYDPHNELQYSRFME